MTPLYASRIDKNHAEIRDAVRKAGYFWLDTFRAGEGVPDSFVLSKTGRWLAFEIKSRDTGKLTTKEANMINEVFNYGGIIYLVYSAEQVLDWLAMEDNR